jgi:hypothetical protein
MKSLVKTERKALEFVERCSLTSIMKPEQPLECSILLLSSWELWEPTSTYSPNCCRQVCCCRRLPMGDHESSRVTHRGSWFHGRIIIAKTAFLWRFCQIASGFHFFGFRNSNFFYRTTLALRPTPNLEVWVTQLYRVFIVQAYQTSQYVVPRGGIFLGKLRPFAGNSRR